MINRNQNKIYNNNLGNNKNKRIIISQNKQMNQISKNMNNSQKKPLASNAPFNNRNIRNNNFLQNQNSNTNNNENDELGRAILMIRRELKRKDDRILELERKVKELTNTLNSLTNNNNNNISSTTPFKVVPKGGYDMEEDNKIGRDIRPRGLSLRYGGLNNLVSLGNNNIRGSRSVTQNNPNYNSDNENMSKRYTGYDNLSHSNDNSVLTYNGVQSNSKKQVKNYLKEVKSKIEPKKFKEFIRYIKSLTAKNNSALNRDIIMESVRTLFGEEHKDLFIRFENIIGPGK